MDRASNAKGNGKGIVIFNTKGGMIKWRVRITFPTTNNMAKYEIRN